MPNRFEQVLEAPTDAMTLSLARDGETLSGSVSCPAAATYGRLPKDFKGAAMPLKEAFRSAIRLANEYKVPLVVVDPDGLWQPEWGELYREDAASIEAPGTV